MVDITLGSYTLSLSDEQTIVIVVVIAILLILLLIPRKHHVYDEYKPGDIRVVKTPSGIRYQQRTSVKKGFGVWKYVKNPDKTGKYNTM